jgi:hypothetical protein
VATTYTELTYYSLKARGKGAPKKKREKGMFGYPLRMMRAASAVLTPCCCRPQEEIDDQANGTYMRHDVYNYCIEEGNNIPNIPSD